MEHSLTWGEVSSVASAEYVNLITVRSGRPRRVGHADDDRHARRDPHREPSTSHAVEIAPASSMLVVHNDDRPGMIGLVGPALGAAEISISSMAVGPDPKSKTALMVLSTEAPTPGLR